MQAKILTTLAAMSALWMVLPAQAGPDWNVQIVPPAAMRWRTAPVVLPSADPLVTAKPGSSPFVDQARVLNFNRHIVEMRQDVAKKLSAAQLSATDAYALNAKLDNLLKLEYQFKAAGGITQPELSDLYLHLNHVRVAGTRNPWFF